MDSSNVETALQSVVDSGRASATWIAYSRSSHSGCSAGWLAGETLKLLASRQAEIDRLQAQIDSMTTELRLIRLGVNAKGRVDLVPPYYEERLVGPWKAVE